MIKKGFLTGLLVFGLFFGAGNLIFPPVIGVLSGHQFTPAILGFVFSAVGIATFTLVVGLSTGRDYKELISTLVHPIFAKVFLLALYLTIGPLFAIPRTASTSFSIGIEPLLSADQKSLVLALFCIVYFALTYWLSVTPSKLMERVGKLLTPLFSGMIVLLIILGVLQLPSHATNVTTAAYTTSIQAFGSGFLEGYNTLDSLAAVAFSLIALNTLKTFGFTSKRGYKRTIWIAGMSVALLFSVLYLGLAVLGNRFAIPAEFDGNVGTYVLSQMTQRVFGQPAQIFLAVMVIVTCMTTTVGLVVSISEFFKELFPKVTYKTYVRVFCVLGVCIANIGLSAIIQLAVPVLLLLYPITIALVVFIFTSQFIAVSRVAVRATMAFVVVLSIAQVIGSTFKVATLNSVLDVLPLNSIGMPWVVPVIIGVVVAIVLPSQKMTIKMKGEFL